MALAEFNWTPTPRQLRQFGGIALAALPLLAWFWGGNGLAIAIAAGVGGALFATAWIYPPAVKPVFVGLSLLVWPIGLVVGEVMLWLAFAVAFVPMGILFRLLRRDRLQLKVDRESPSYWEPRSAPADLRRYFRQF
jgi:hypothetical protein